MFTKTQAKIMEVFVSKIEKKFSIKEISDILKKPYPLIHRSIRGLIQDEFLTRDDKELISLNYKKNISEITYIESLRSKMVIKKDKILLLFVNDVLNNMKSDFFIFLVFGSYVEKTNPRDIDLLFIIEDEKKINETEKIILNISKNFTKNFEIQVVSIKSAYEMFSKRDKINILNETLNKHILLFGAENYYSLLKNAR